MNIAPGQTVEGKQTFVINQTGSPDLVHFDVKIFSHGYHCWSDSFRVTAIEKYEERLPKIFALQQNYPNPFNPKTIINYELPITNDVSLNIYNLLGQKVAMLVHERQNAGQHQVEWDASGFASGIYYYKIEAGEFQQVRKMILLR